MFLEVGTASASKYNEELCGDNIEIVFNNESTIIVLSDGLGSGVKANILATLTTKIASGLLEKGIPIEEAVETIAKTLPVCQERQLAYSTLTVLQIFNNGRAYLIEIDNPTSFFVDNKNNISKIDVKKRKIGEKEIKEAHLQLNEGESIMLVSDGVIHAGIGGVLNFGLGWDGVAHHLQDVVNEYESSNKMAKRMVELCEAYYCMKPGDDTTVAIVKSREKREVTLFSGPPKDKRMDKEVVNKLMAASGTKVVCGGTTSKIVARCLDAQLEVETDYYDFDVPPICKIEGIDLATEGLLTLNKSIERIKEVDCYEDLERKEDGATKLAEILLKSDAIKLLVGMAVNPAHQSLKLPEDMAIRKQIIKELIYCLKEKDKEISIKWF